MTLTCPGEAIQTPSWHATIVPMFRILLVSLAVVSLACSAMAQAPRNGTLAGRPGTNLAVLRSNASLTGPRFQRSLSTWPLKTSIKPAALHARYTGTMAKLDCYSVVVPNKPGKGAKVLSAFQEAGVNFLAVWGYPVGKGKSRIDLVAEDTARLKKAAKKLKIELGTKQTAFHITGEDHPGAVAEVLAKLAAKEVNVNAVQAICAGNGRFGTLVQVAPDDVKKAKKALA